MKINKSFLFIVCIIFCASYSLFAQNIDFLNPKLDYKSDLNANPLPYNEQIKSAINGTKESNFILKKRGSVTVLDTSKLVDFKKSVSCPFNYLVNTLNYSVITLRDRKATSPATGTNNISLIQRFMSENPVSLKSVGVYLKPLNTSGTNVTIKVFGRKSNGSTIELLGQTKKNVTGTNYSKIYFDFSSDIYVNDTITFLIAPETFGKDSLSVVLTGVYGGSNSGTGSIAGTTLTMTAYSNYGFGIGNVISGNGITPGTKIIDQTGAGVFVVDQNQNVSSTTISTQTKKFGYLGAYLNVDNIPTSGQTQSFKSSIFGADSQNQPYETDAVIYPVFTYNWDSKPTLSNKCLGNSNNVTINYSNKAILTNPLFNRMAVYVDYQSLSLDKGYYYTSTLSSLDNSITKNNSTTFSFVKKYPFIDKNDTLRIDEILYTYKVTSGKYVSFPVSTKFLISSKIDAQISSQDADPGQTNGVVSVVANGGYTPYNYSWNNSSSNTSVINVGKGTYSATVTDANQCLIPSASIDVKEKVTLSSEKILLSFSINSVNANITGNNVSLKLSAGTSLIGLIPTFTSSAKSIVKIGTVKQISGQTANDFIKSVEYIVEAEDGTTQIYTVTVILEQAPKSNVCDITSFGISSPATNGTITGTNISVTVKSGTSLTALVAQFIASKGATVKVGTMSQVSGQTANDFTNVLSYVVTAEDGTTSKTYTVKVLVEQAPKSNACDITAFSITNPASNGTITGTNISVTVKSGTSLTALIAQFTASAGSTVKIGSTTQASGQTANDFTNALSYVVTAEDGIATKTYTVTVKVQAETCKDLDNWAKGNNKTPNLYSAGANGFEKDGYLTGVNMNYFSGLYEKFTDIGDTKNHQIKSISYWFGSLVSGNTTNTMQFIGYKPDAITKLPKDTIFIITKTVNDVEKALDQYGMYNLDLTSTKVKFSGDFYVGITMQYQNAWGAASGTNPQDTIALLSNDYQGSGATLNSAYIGIKTKSGNIFDTLIPKATISLAIWPTICDLSSANDIISFGFTNPSSQGVITGNSVSISVPFGTDLKKLTPTFTISADASISIGSVKQISGQTSNDYTNIITYLVTAEDGTTKSYTVQVTLLPAPKSKECDIIAYSFKTPAVVGTINGTAISLTVLAGTNVTKLISEFTVSVGSTVKVGATNQVSGQTTNDFTNPILYVVTAEDGITSKQYIVTVTTSQTIKNNACEITSFKFVSPNITGNISNTTITVNLPSGTNLTSLIAQFTLSTGASVKVGSTNQISGQTANDFTNALSYLVTAEDGVTTKKYTVNVVVNSTMSSAKEILTFGFTNPSISATINGTSITATVPNGTDVSTLVATFTTSPKATVTVKNVTQQSGKNLNDFTTIVSYIVTAEDGSMKTFTVSVSELPKLSSDKDFLSFSIKTPLVNGIILGTTINLVVPDGTLLSSLIANFTVSPKATVKIAAADQTSGLTSNNFTSTVVYTVTAEDGSTKNYTVIITSQSTSGSSAKDLISFGIYQPIIPSVINGNSVTITSSTKSIDLSSLLISFEVSPGAKLVLSGTTLTSRVSRLNFSNSITVTVIAADGSKKDYIINLLLPKSNQNEVIFFKSMNPYSVGKIDVLKKEIHISVPYGTLVSQIQPVFMVSEGAKVMIGVVQQISGANTVDFTKPVVYTIVAEDGTTTSYTVYIDVQPKSTLGLEDEEINFVSIYPNPSNGIFTLKALNNSLKISVIDATGREVFFKDFKSYDGEELQLDLSSFGKGIYFANIQNNELARTIKLEVID